MAAKGLLNGHSYFLFTLFSTIKDGFYGGFGRSGGGAPIVGNNGMIQTSKKQTFVRGDDGGNIDPPSSCHNFMWSFLYGQT